MFEFILDYRLQLSSHASSLPPPPSPSSFPPPSLFLLLLSPPSLSLHHYPSSLHPSLPSLSLPLLPYLSLYPFPSPFPLISLISCHSYIPVSYSLFADFLFSHISPSLLPSSLLSPTTSHSLSSHPSLSFFTFHRENPFFCFSGTQCVPRCTSTLGISRFNLRTVQGNGGLVGAPTLRPTI